MDRRIIFIILLLPLFLLGQTVDWSDVTVRYPSDLTDTTETGYAETGLIFTPTMWNKLNRTVRLMQQHSSFRASDTTEMKTLTGDSAYVVLKGLSSTNTLGGGIFVEIDSAYTESIVAFDNATAGKQWIRIESINNLDYCNLRWAGLINGGTITTVFDNVVDAGFKDIFIPAGRYYGTINADVTGLKITGGSGVILGEDADSSDHVYIYPNEASDTLLYINSELVEVNNLILWGRTATDTAKYGVWTGSNDRVRLNYVQVKLCSFESSTIGYGLYTYGFGSEFDNCHFVNSDVNIYFASHCSNTSFYHCKIGAGYKYEIWHENVGNLQVNFTDCDLETSESTQSDTLIFLSRPAQVNFVNLYCEMTNTDSNSIFMYIDTMPTSGRHQINFVNSQIGDDNTVSKYPIVVASDLMGTHQLTINIFGGIVYYRHYPIWSVIDIRKHYNFYNTTFSKQAADRHASSGGVTRTILGFDSTQHTFRSGANTSLLEYNYPLNLYQSLQIGENGSVVDSAKLVVDTLKFYVGGNAYNAVLGD